MRFPAVAQSFQDAATASGNKIRLLYHVTSDFEKYEIGAMWDDAKVGLQHLTSWQRVASSARPANRQATKIRVGLNRLKFRFLRQHGMPSDAINVARSDTMDKQASLRFGNWTSPTFKLFRITLTRLS